MVFREISIVEVKEILRRLRSGERLKRIAKSLGICPKTVRRYRDEAMRRGMLSSEVVLSDKEITAVAKAVRHANEQLEPLSDKVLQPYQSRIITWVKGEYRLTTMKKLLKNEGVDVTYPVLRRFAMKHCGFGKVKSTVRLADTKPGIEAQVDWGLLGEIFDPVTHKNRRLWVLIVTLSHSRHIYLHVTFKTKTSDLIHGLEGAWEFFGGVTKRLIIDNQKPAVQKADIYEPIENKTFLEYSQYRGFIIDPTRGAHPRGNAKTERNVQYVRESFFRGEIFLDIEDSQKKAVRWCLETAGTRHHSATGRSPLTLFETEEKATLLPLTGGRFDIPIWGKAQVYRDHHIQFQKAFYSVPTQYIGKDVIIRGDSAIVRIYCGSELIKIHPRKKPYEQSTDFNDYPKEKAVYATRNPALCIESAGRLGPFVKIFCEKLLAGDFPWSKMRQAQKLIRLGERFGSDRLDAAAQRAVSFDLINVNRLETILCRSLAPDDLPQKGNHVVPLPGRFERPPQSFSARKEKEKGNGNITGFVKTSEASSSVGNGGDSSGKGGVRRKGKA
jgi:transposase